MHKIKIGWGEDRIDKKSMKGGIIMSSLSSWSWQKWVGKIAPIVTGLLSVGVWEFFELPAPIWAGTIAGVVTFLVQQILALIPPKE